MYEVYIILIFLFSFFMESTMKKKKSKLTKTYSFRAAYGLEKAVEEIFGKKISTIFGEISEDIMLVDPEDEYNHQIFRNNQKLKELKSDIKHINSKEENLKQQLKELETIETKLKSKKMEIEKENYELQSKKREYKEKSINSFIQQMLLLYVKDEAMFDDVAVQMLLDELESEFSQNVIIKGTMRYLNSHRFEEMELNDNKSSDKKTYTVIVDDEVIKSVGNVLKKLIIKKG